FGRIHGVRCGNSRTGIVRPNNISGEVGSNHVELGKRRTAGSQKIQKFYAGLRSLAGSCGDGEWRYHGSGVGAGGDGVVGVGEEVGGGTGLLKDGLHVVLRVTFHASDKDGNGAAARRCRDRPGLEVVAGVLAELNKYG